MKPSEALPIEVLSKRFVDALTSNDYDAIAELLISTSATSSAAEVAAHLDGLTEGQRIDNAFFEVVAESSSSDGGGLVVHVCFDTSSK